MEGNRYMDKLDGKGEDRKAQEAVEKKPPPHIPPGHRKERDVEHQIKNDKGKLWKLVVQEQAETCDAAGREMVRDEDPVDGKGRKAASKGEEKQIFKEALAVFNPGSIRHDGYFHKQSSYITGARLRDEKPGGLFLRFNTGMGPFVPYIQMAFGNEK